MVNKLTFYFSVRVGFYHNIPNIEHVTPSITH